MWNDKKWRSPYGRAGGGAAETDLMWSACSLGETEKGQRMLGSTGLTVKEDNDSSPSCLTSVQQHGIAKALWRDANTVRDE